MNKGIKLFGQSKETKELERNPVNLRRVRDFVARYSDPDDLSFPDFERSNQPIDEEAQSFSFATERPNEEQAKKTKNKGNALNLNRSRASTTLTKTNRTSDSTSADPPQEEFPFIELPATNDDENRESLATTSTPAQNLLATENGPVTFGSFSVAPFEESEREAKLPHVQPIELDRQEEGAASAKETVPNELVVEDAYVTTGQGATFTFIDEAPAKTKKPRGVRTSPLHGHRENLSTRGRDTELMLAASFSADEEVLTVEPVVAKGEKQQEQSGTPSLEKTTPFLQRTKQRRIKKTHVRIGQRKTSVTENIEETDVLSLRGENEVHDLSSSEPPVVALNGMNPESLAGQRAFPKESAYPDRREQAPTQKVDTREPSAKQEGVGKPRAVQRELDSLDPCLVSFLAPDSFEAEQYRALRHLVERLSKERGRSCIIAVSSPSAGDGKTTTALNLAGALAQVADARVLLIEADLCQPTVLERLGGQLAANRGLVNAVLHPRLRLQNTTIQYAFLNLTILPAGHLTSSSYEIFKASRFGALLEDARRAYDYIILDTPPLVPIPDCRLIEQWVDGFFVVVAAHKTPRKLVQEALVVIPEEKILGFVFNRDDPPVFGYEQYPRYSPLRTMENSNSEKLV